MPAKQERLTACVYDNVPSDLAVLQRRSVPNLNPIRDHAVVQHNPESRSHRQRCEMVEASDIASTYFSPITTPSITTQLVNFDPLPTKQPLPMMHRLTPTFSPKLAYTLGCK